MNHKEEVAELRNGLNNGLRKLNELTPMTLAERICLDAVKREHQINASAKIMMIFYGPDESLIEEYIEKQNGSPFKGQDETKESARKHFRDFAEDEERNLCRLRTERELLMGYIENDEQMQTKYNELRERFPTA